MTDPEPENTIRDVVDGCADCDVCRYLMDSSCQMFPQLYRLYDKEAETGVRITSEELRKLVDLCTFCALCPCPNVRAGIIEAKTSFIDRDGLRFGVRTLEDVERIGRVGGACPALTNLLLKKKFTGAALKRVAGMHPARKMPRFPSRNFQAWAAIEGLCRKGKPGPERKVAYFAGCTAKHLFPDVAKAVVSVLRHNGIEVYYPEQRCCGMPTMLEGDRPLTLKFVSENLDHLGEVVEDGYDIVCSCPTCGFMLRNTLKEGAYYSPEYQKSAGGDEATMVVPEERGPGFLEGRRHGFLKRSMYKDILKDDGYFSCLNPLKRILVAEHTFDMGEYLTYLHRTGQLKTTFGSVPGRMIYYPPCHLREQAIGRPYLDLLGLISGISLEPVEGNLHCCGMAGIMGFKQEFHELSIRVGGGLMEKIKEMQPERLVTDCLSCRLQFHHTLPYDVYHPVEILREAYARSRTGEASPHKG